MSDFEDFLDDVFDPDYLYVEESYDIADDLAERAVASPVPFDHDDDLLDYDQFDYWEDIEYNDDGFYDARVKRGRKRVESVTEKAGQKRKKGVETSSPQKRQKATSGKARVASGAESPTPTVVWRKYREEPRAPTVDNFDRSFALLKDWRERFADISGFEAAKSANRTPHENISCNELLSPPSDADDEGVDMDMDVLKAALRNNLAKLGAAPEGIDESTLLQFAARILQDRDAADDIVGELADNILGGGEEDDSEEEVRIPEWLAQQLNPKMTDRDEKDYAVTPQKEQRLPTPASSKSSSSAKSAQLAVLPTLARRNDVPSLPVEETIPAPADEPEASHTIQPDELHQAQDPEDAASDPRRNRTSPRKRKAANTNDQTVPVPEPKLKRRAPSYAAPTTTSKAKVTAATGKAKAGAAKTSRAGRASRG